MESDHLDTYVNRSLADSKRALEIAKLSTFGFLEFYELTGIDAGEYGIYDLDDQGVRLRLSDDDSELTGRQRLAIRNAREKLVDLDFPCTPQSFCNWYQTTCGTNSVSDFPLAEGFFKAVTKKEPIALRNSEPPVTASEIIEAFDVVTDRKANDEWWNDRMRSAKKYGLVEARISQGRRGIKNSSLWHPVAVASWLIERKCMEKTSVIHLTRTHFPDYDVDYIE